MQTSTLPGEGDAGRSANEQWCSLCLVSETEREGISKVLGADAWTYVAAMVRAGMQLLYLLAATRNRN